jgi:FAS-associated factor 2
MEAPSSEQIARFMDAAHCDADQARFFLEASGSNFDLAFQTWAEQFGGPQPMPHSPMLTHGMHASQPPAGPPAGSSRRMAVPPRPRAPVAHAGPLRSLTLSVLRVPFTLARSGLGLAWSVASFSLGVAAFMGDRVLPAGLMRGVRGTVAALTALPDDLDPAEQARRFLQQFKSSYGDRHPRFVESGIKQAITQAKNEFKFLFVYLHSSEHQDTDQYCSDVLCHPDVVAYVNSHFVSWGGDVRFSDAYQFSQRLEVTRYPYVALLNTTPSNQVQLVAAMQGPTEPGTLLAHLTAAEDQHGMVLMAQRLELQEREFARRLREEQNQEYESSLAADRERDVLRQAERERAEAEALEAEREAQRQRMEVEAEERARQELLDALARRRAEGAAALGPEPEAGPGTALVRLRLPDGSSSQRRFLAGDPMSCVFRFVDSLDSTTFLRYTLVSSYPRKVFSRDGEADDAAAAVSDSVSLQDAGLVPQAALFVQPEECPAAGATAS